MKLEFNYSAVGLLKNPFEGATFQRIKRTLLTIMMGQKDQGFEGQHDPDGNAWAPLSKSTVAKRKKGSKSQYGNNILRDSGVLFKSLTDAQAPYEIRSTEGNEVILGTNIPYAAIHQFGGVIQFPGTDNGFGIPGFKIKAHPITIPARPFIGLGDKDQEEVSEYLAHATSEGVKP